MANTNSPNFAAQITRKLFILIIILGFFLLICKSTAMSERLSEQAESRAERIRSGRVLTVRDDNAANAPVGKGFEENSVAEAKLRVEPIKRLDSSAKL